MNRDLHRQHDHTRPLSVAERKRQLIEEGAAFRNDVLHSRQVLTQKMHAMSVTKTLLGTAVGVASLVASSQLTKTKTVAPLLMTGAHLLTKKPFRKLFTAGALAVSAFVASKYFKR